MTRVTGTMKRVPEPGHGESAHRDDALDRFMTGSSQANERNGFFLGRQDHLAARGRVCIFGRAMQSVTSSEKNPVKKITNQLNDV
jgi:hypothetical protein